MVTQDIKITLPFVITVDSCKIPGHVANIEEYVKRVIEIHFEEIVENKLVKGRSHALGYRNNGSSKMEIERSFIEMSRNDANRFDTYAKKAKKKRKKIKKKKKEVHIHIDSLVNGLTINGNVDQREKLEITKEQIITLLNQAFEEAVESVRSDNL